MQINFIELSITIRIPKVICKITSRIIVKRGVTFMNQKREFIMIMVYYPIYTFL